MNNKELAKKLYDTNLGKVLQDIKNSDIKELFKKSVASVFDYGSDSNKSIRIFSEKFCIDLEKSTGSSFELSISGVKDGIIHSDPISLVFENKTNQFEEIKSFYEFVLDKYEESVIEFVSEMEFKPNLNIQKEEWSRNFGGIIGDCPAVKELNERDKNDDLLKEQNAVADKIIDKILQEELEADSKDSKEDQKTRKYNKKNG
jgi:hypothetical protein